MTGATDARQYLEICDRVFRFSPMVMSPEDQKRCMESTNESHMKPAANGWFMVEVIEKCPLFQLISSAKSTRMKIRKKRKSKNLLKEKPLKTRPMKKAEDLVEEA